MYITRIVGSAAVSSAIVLGAIAPGAGAAPPAPTAATAVAVQAATTTPTVVKTGPYDLIKVTRQKKARYRTFTLGGIEAAVRIVVKQKTRHFGDGSEVKSLYKAKLTVPKCTVKGGKRRGRECTKGEVNWAANSIRGLKHVYVVVRNPRASDPPRPSSVWVTTSLGSNALAGTELFCSGPCEFSVAAKIDRAGAFDNSVKWNGRFKR